MLWEWHHCLLQVPTTLLASRDVASQCFSPPVLKREEKEQGEEGATRGVDSGHLQKAPKPFQSALRSSGGLGSSRDSSTAWTLLQPGQVSLHSESQAGGTRKSDRGRVLGVPLTQTTFLRTKTPEMGHSSPCLGPAGP